MQQHGANSDNALVRNFLFYSVISLMAGILAYAMTTLPVRS